MTWALWCVLIAGLLPYLGTMAAKWGFDRFDNGQPREWLAKQTGFRARGNAAQANSFEAFPFFAAAVLTATMTKAPLATVDALATVFIVARILYIGCYITDRATLRSLCWLVGIICVVGLFVVSAT
jgi:uncharacterized MAPEG superfamily protein